MAWRENKEFLQGLKPNCFGLFMSELKLRPPKGRGDSEACPIVVTQSLKLRPPKHFYETAPNALKREYQSRPSGALCQAPLGGS